MTARCYAWVSIPALVLLALAPLAESVSGLPMIGSALVAVILTWPVALVTLWWVRRQDNPRRFALVWIAASLIRILVAVAGSVLVYLAFVRTTSVGLWYWFWIVLAYLSTLTVEVFVLAKPGWVGRGAGGRTG